MSYLGSPPASQAFAPGTDTFSGTGSQTAFTLSRNVATVNDIQVVVNNVVQQPSNYSVSTSTLTFSPAPSSGTNNIYVRYLSTNITAVVPYASGTPSSTTFYRGDNTWAVPSGGGGGVTSFSAGSTGLTPNTATTGAVALAGTLAVASGGTGLTSTPANGALDIGNGTGFTRTTLTAGSGVTITNGAGSISIAASGGGGGGFSSWQVFTSSGTFTVPTGITKVKVTVVGGGGGSGASRADTCCTFPATSGGGGGGAAIEIISGLTPGGTVSVTVGAGGTAGTSAAVNGGTGGTSSFGAYCSATGGSGSASKTNVGDFYSYSGGLGSGGDLNIRGGYGSACAQIPGEFGGGNGGASILGGGVVGFNGQYVNVGTAGGAYGGGAGGSKNQPGAGVLVYAGAAGAAGVVIVEY
jgi:hypothetical protein